MAKDKTKDYQELGRLIEKIFIKDYLEFFHNWRRFALISFMRGLFFGFGSIVGATILVTIFIWLVSMFGKFPLIGDIFQETRETLQR